MTENLEETDDDIVTYLIEEYEEVVEEHREALLKHINIEFRGGGEANNEEEKKEEVFKLPVITNEIVKE